MTELLTVTSALGFLALLGVPQNAEARTYFNLSIQPTYVAPQPYYVVPQPVPQPYYVAPEPYYVAPTYVVPQYYYPERPCYRVREYTPWGVVYRRGYY